MISRGQRQKSGGSRLPAGAAGAGGGTLLVLLANNLPPTNPWKSWLALIAPSVSVAVTALAALLKRYFETRLARRELISLISEAKQTLTAALANPQTSEEHKTQLRKELEKLELLSVQADLEKIKALTVRVIALT